MNTRKEDVSAIVEHTAQASRPDNHAIQNAIREEASYYRPQNMSEHLAWENLKMRIKDNEAERELRKGHATKSFWLTLVWAAFIGLIILLKGFGVLQLDRIEFLSVIGALTTSVFAFYLLVMKFLFSKETNRSLEKSPGDNDRR